MKWKYDWNSTIKDFGEKEYFEYERHSPQETALYEIIQKNVNTVFQNLENKGKIFPSFIRQEFDAFLDCGILANGFLRIKCSSCMEEKLLAFSCKKRGFCSSCGGRRMAESAAHLVDNVFPDQPLRQWVLSFPYNLRYVFAYNGKALHLALQIMIRIIDRYYIKKGKKSYGFKGKTGAVTLIQRFGGHLNLNPHFHVLYLDGIYNNEGKFFEIARPSEQEMAEIILKIKKRVFRSLGEKGYIDNYDINLEDDKIYNEYPALFEILNASIQNRIYLEESGKSKIETIGGINGLWVESRGAGCVYKDGFSLHCNLRIGQNDLKGRERLCRYIARPSISEKRLRLSEDEKWCEYRLKRPWSNGTHTIKFTCEELIIKLIALIPPPRMNLTRYHGVLAPNASIRKKVVKKSREASEKKKNRRYIEWAKLLKRVFNIDIVRCKCGGEIKIISVITKTSVIIKILEHLSLPSSKPEIAPARAPPSAQMYLFDPA